MPVNRFYIDSLYRGTDYYLDMSESIDGVDQNMQGATFAGILDSKNGSNSQVFSFTLIDDFTLRASVNETETARLDGGEYNMTIRIRYPNGRDSVLINGIMQIKEVYT